MSHFRRDTFEGGVKGLVMKTGVRKKILMRKLFARKIRPRCERALTVVG